MSANKKAEELLYKASLKKSFDEDLINIRKEYNISEIGFDTLTKACGWRFANKGKFVDFFVNKSKETAESLLKEREFNRRLIEILKKYDLPITLLYSLEEYVLYNKPFNIPNQKPYFACAIDNPKWDNSPLSEDEYWKYMDISYVRLLIHRDATRHDVKKYIDRNWSEITMYFNKKRKTKTNRIRVSGNRQRDEMIFELYSKTREELCLKKGEYKDIVVSGKMNELGFMEVTSDIVRTIVSRQRKLRDL